MARSKLKGVIKRQLALRDVSAPVVLTIGENGVDMAVAGFQTKISGSWETIAKALTTPTNVPSILHQRPLEFLKHQAAKYQKKREDQSAS